jgi:PAS domain S-box-containing protein
MDELRKLSRAIEQSPVSVLITDLNGSIEYANPKFSEITGYSLAESKGCNPRILKTGFTSDQEYKKLWDQITSGGEWRGEFQNKRKDGSMYWENAIISPIRNSSGEITHFVAVKEDVTEKKQIMQELIIQKEHAEESDRLKTAFIQNISHEIRTPLNAIVGFSSLLATSDVPNEKRKEFIKIIENSNDQLLSIISGIINIATLESGIDKVIEKETDLNNLMRNVYAQLKSSRKTPELVFDPPVLPAKKIVIITDPVKLMQVLVNLVGNALKFTSSGYVKFGYSVHDDIVQFLVEDTGIGIPNDMQDLIFQRFRQLDNSSTRKYGGTGLGLALSKGYITLMGGNISLVSEPGKGSCFTITIPFKPVAPSAGSGQQDLTDQAPRLKTVLVAEDELNSYYYIHQLLTMYENTVVRASNGLDAINRCEESLPDIILMDIKMPVMDGLEATTIIRQKHPDLPVIALTAFALEADKKLILETGFDGFIEKPVKPDKLFEAMMKVLNEGTFK